MGTYNTSDTTSGLLNAQAEAILDSFQQHKASSILIASAVAVFTWFCVGYHFSPLRKCPGPFLAGWTNLWRFSLAVLGKHGPTLKNLHQKYGPVVRTGPNLLSLDIPSLVRLVYNTDGKWLKTDFYKNNSAVVDGKIVYHLFSETDTNQHAILKRPIVRHYSVPSVLKMEPLMDQVIGDFCEQLERRFIDADKRCPLDSWLVYYAWDFISAVTFSKRFGYLDKGCDFEGILRNADQAIDYLGIVGQMPWLDFCLEKNPIMRMGPPNLGRVTQIATEPLFSRLEGKDPNFDHKQPDFLQYFIDSKSTHPDVVDNPTVLGYLLLNLIAGADTTAITMKALFYHCLRTPHAWRRLNDEILAAKLDSTKPASYSSARALAYLEAVARETMRMHPAVSMTMERVVPSDGLRLPDGSFIPAGTMVGMNPYVTGRNEEIFGQDAEKFNPDRWLKQESENDEKYQERMRLWNATDLTFGGGSRICLGRNLSMMELYKVVATVIMRYEIELVDPNEKWNTVARWFYRVDGGLTCRLRRRTG